VIKGHSLGFGAGGGGLGYLGMTNSAAVEFDIYNNSPLYNDPNGNHVGIDAGGAFDSAPGETNTAPVSPSMKNGNRWFAWIDYDGSVWRRASMRLASDRACRTFRDRQYHQ